MQTFIRVVTVIRPETICLIFSGLWKEQTLRLENPKSQKEYFYMLRIFLLLGDFLVNIQLFYNPFS